MSYFLYSETAFHHEGDLNYLLDLVKLTKQNQYHGIKFQVIGDLSTYMAENHSQFKYLNKMVFKLDDWKTVIDYAKTLELKVVFMPLDIMAMDWALDHLNLIDYFDIHSVSFYDRPLWEKIKQSQRPIILGIGGRTLSEIEDALKYFDQQLQILMHGFQSFPTVLTDARLLRISALKETFNHLTVGYADHSSYDSDDAVKALEYAYLLGARVFEKHITLSEGVNRTDFSAAVGSDKMLQIREQLLRLEIIYKDSDVFELRTDEIKYRERQKKLVALHNIAKGESISPTNTILKVIEESNNVLYVNHAINHEWIAPRAIKKDEPILLTDVPLV